MPCVQIWRRGRHEATGPKSRYARAWALFFAAVDNAHSRIVSWIPSHTSKQDVVDGLISQFDKDCNDVVDDHAKTMAKRHTASMAAEQRYVNYSNDVVTVAQGALVSLSAILPTATLTSARPQKPLANVANLTSLLLRRVCPPPVAALRALEHGGHCLRDDPQGWRCSVCRVASASWNAIAPQRCRGSAAAAWAKRASACAADSGELGRGHTLWLSDATVWCSTCGQFSTEATKGLKDACHPLVAGTTTIRNRLMSGKHPRTNLPFAASAVPQFRWQLTDGGSVPAPSSAACASRTPRGSAAAAKRLSSTGYTAAPRPGPSFDTLQLAWVQPAFVQRAWARPSAEAVAASRAAVAAMREAASDAPPPKRSCVVRNAAAPSPMVLVDADSTPLADDEPRSKVRRTGLPDSCSHVLSSAMPRGSADDTAPASDSAAWCTSEQLFACDEPPAKHLRRSEPVSAFRALGAASGSSASAPAASSHAPAEPCSTAASAAASRLEAATSIARSSTPSDFPRPLGSPPWKVTSPAIHCTARCSPIATREDLLRQLSTSGSTCTASSSRPFASPSQPVQKLRKRSTEAHFPQNHDLPAKRSRPSSSSNLGEFAAFFQKK